MNPLNSRCLPVKLYLKKMIKADFIGSEVETDVSAVGLMEDETCLWSTMIPDKNEPRVKRVVFNRRVKPLIPATRKRVMLVWHLLVR